jgi:hypothetical protein
MLAPMPLLPILNRYKPVGSTAEVNFKTTRFDNPTELSGEFSLPEVQNSGI